MSENSQTIGDFSFCRPSQILPIYRIKPVFHMSGKSQTIGDFTFSRPSQILPIYRIIARRLSQILPIMNLAGNGKCAKNRVLNKNLTAFIQQHWCTRAYAATFSIDDWGFYFFATIPDFAYVSDNRQKTVPDSPYYELGGKWKVCKKSSLEQKCNSIYTATLMHTSLCCVVLNTSLFLHPSMQGFPFWKSRGQLKIPDHSSSFLGKRLEIAMTRIFEKHHVYLFLFTIGGLEPSK